MKKTLIIASSVLIVIGCGKKNSTPTIENTQAIDYDKYERMTLKDFSTTRTSEIEKNFFKNMAISDNNIAFTKYISDIKSNQTQSIISKPKIKFKWHGVEPIPDPQGRGGCDVPLGICIILGINNTSGVTGTIDVSTSYSNGKLILLFDSNVSTNYGLTIDGYLPILFNLDIPSDLAPLLGIPSSNPKIKAGIYKAYYDSASSRYIGIALDIIL